MKAQLKEGVVGATGFEPPSSSVSASTGNRCARRRYARSLPTVSAEGKRSVDVQGNALFHNSNSACTGRSLHLQRSSTIV